ncbi:MAG: type III-B CRISPR module-associated protein Cmr5 [Bryobacteraceae bacterium]|nr:type III-B CRISPR module-associated protein Cmr5 [Bryobacteraceae bacterium]
MRNDQERARHALDRLREVEKQSEKVRKSYRSYVERLGPAILINGLGQALAMEVAAAGRDKRKEDEQAHFQLYQNLNHLLSQPGEVFEGKLDVLDALISGDQEQYVAAQTEALAWLSWHKKFCQAYLPREEDVP